MILVGDTNLEAETSTETLTKYLDLCQAGCEEGRPLFSSPSKHLLRRQTARIAVAPLLGEATVWQTDATGPPSITETRPFALDALSLLLRARASLDVVLQGDVQVSVVANATAEREAARSKNERLRGGGA